jgi:hypothetical protein
MHGGDIVGELLVAHVHDTDAARLARDQDGGDVASYEREQRAHPVRDQQLTDNVTAMHGASETRTVSRSRVLDKTCSEVRAPPW